MRILAISDKVVPVLYSPGIRERVGKVDLIVSCGDLPFYYLDYVISMLDRPCYFVYGNHGREAEHWANDMVVRGPAGATNLHCAIHRDGGLLLAGLEGSMRYNDAPRFQYTEWDMWLNVGRLVPGFLQNRLRFGRWIDVLVTHSPPFGIHDESDRAHTGFRSFLHLMRIFQPRYLLHGHIHIYRNETVTVTRYESTDVINVYPYQLIEIDRWECVNGRSRSG